MKVILISAGTAGNTLPFIGLGRHLRERGHQVVLGASHSYRDIAAREGLEFAPVDRPLGETAFDPQKPGLSRRAMLKQLGAEGEYLLRVVYRLIAEQYVPGQTVVVCQSWLFGGRVAHDHLGVPLATVHLQPLLFRSVYDRPWYLPAMVKRGGYWLLDALMDLGGMRKSVNQLRGELGLPAVTRLMQSWCWSPQLAIGFFPAWFVQPQPDWPAQTLLAGFPRFDALQTPPDRAGIEAFLAADSPPLVFSQASILKDSHEYFRICAEIAQRMGRRALLLTAHPEHLPDNLPADVKSFGFIPLSEVLPRAAAFIHHGGLGSISAALAAGVPQLTVPKLLDQPSNSRYLARLGVSANVKPARFNAANVAPLLTALLESEQVAERCRHFAQLSQPDDTFARVADALERLLATSCA